MVEGDFDDAARRRVGRPMGKYRLDALLGVGGMAFVYRATEATGRAFAIKLLRDELANDGAVRTRFIREAELANAVEHPAVVRVLDKDVDEQGVPFLVLELLDGESLEDRRLSAGGRLPCDEVARIARELLDVLAAAHAAGVVHRDIKPENLFLADGKLRVLDFGLARATQPSADALRVTVTGARLGTAGFMAPELALGRHDDVDARTDLWSVGATMFFLLAGRCVHETASAHEALLAVATQPAPPLARVAPHVPPRIAAVVDRALAMQKEKRFADAADMLRALDAATGSARPMTHTEAAKLALASTRPAFAPMPLRAIVLETRERASSIAPAATSARSSNVMLLLSLLAMALAIALFAAAR